MTKVGQGNKMNFIAKEETDSKLRPGPRMNTQLTLKNGILYLYGGILEQGDRSYILNDLWSIDIKKMNQWKRINKTDKVNWEGSDKGDSEDEEISEDEPEDEEEDESSEEEEEVKPKRKKPNHPTPFHAETEVEYITRSRGYWKKLLEETQDDEDSEDEDLTEEEILIQSETLAKNWFKKCENARMGTTE